tara:strand:+ start:1014 stop:2240 length:1227 start_codon:yes stop_codon:yes gene_type:complete
MRARVSKSKKNNQTELPNIPVRIKEFIHVKAPGPGGNTINQTGVLGTNMLNGKDEKFFLTVPKNEELAAKYKKRPDLKKWSEPFKEFGQTKEIKPGAVMMFKNCRPFGSDKNENDPIGFHHRATWVDRFADNAQQAQQSFIRGYMVVEGNYDTMPKMEGDKQVLNDKDEPVNIRIFKSGSAYSFETKPDNHITGVPGPELQEQIAAAMAARNNAQMLVRYINEAGQVCYDRFGSNGWEKNENDEFVKRDPADAANVWIDEIKKTMTALPEAVSVNIVPAAKFQLSSKAIEDGNMGRAYKEMDYACTHKADDGSLMKNMQQCFGKTSEDYPNIIFKLDSVHKGDKENPAKDPTLLGQLDYSPTHSANIAVVDAMLNEDAQQTQNQAPADTEEETSDAELFNGAGMSPSP